MYKDQRLHAAAGDVNAISVGANTNIQDGTIVHVARHNPKGQEAPTVIGDNVTIGAKLCPACLQNSALPGILGRESQLGTLQGMARPSTLRLLRTARLSAWAPSCWTA